MVVVGNVEAMLEEGAVMVDFGVAIVVQWFSAQR